MKRIWLILIFALIFRLFLIPTAINGDILTQTEWGKFMYTHSVKGLYTWNQWLNEWPNHPPLISWLYLFAYQTHSFLMMILSNVGTFIALHHLGASKIPWFYNFVVWFGSSLIPNTYYLNGIIVTIKLFMILADIGIAYLIYLVCQKAKISWQKYVAAYLFLPFSWYLSAMWGQSDQLATLFLIPSFILLNSRFVLLAPILFAISLNLKPTGLILVPLFLWVFYKQRRSFVQFLIGTAISLVFTIYISSLFTNRPLYNFLTIELPHRLFEVKTPFTVVSSFNFWFIFHAKDLISESTPYLFISAKNWGYLIFSVISLLSFFVVKHKKTDTIFLAIFLSSFGGWLFLTNMHERYVFAGLVSLLFYSIYHPKYFKYFIILAMTVWCNLYYGWWQPVQLDVLKNIFLWSNNFIPRILSLINVVLYFRIIKRK